MFRESITLSPAEVERYIDVRLPHLKKSGGEFRGPCPIHDGERDSFSINSETGLWCCHSECDRGGDVFSCESEISGADFKTAKAAVYGIIGRAERAQNLRVMPPAPTVQREPLGPIEASYDYVNEAGILVYQVTRYRDPKAFRQRRPDGPRGWIDNIRGVEPVPYNVPAVVKAEKVFICEGEKDADNLAKLDLVTTTNSGGAGNFKPELVRHFVGKHVVILPDNDDKGRSHAESVATLLAPVAESVRVVILPGLPEKGDVSDWLTAGGTEADLRKLVRATPSWEPGSSAPETPAECPGIRCISDLKPISTYATREIDWLVRGILAGATLSMFSGESGSGKSSVVDYLVHQIANGLPVAGIESQRRPVLILDRENPIAIVMERHRRLGVVDDDSLRIWGGWCDDEPCDPASPIVTSWVESCNPKPVIVIDSFVAFAQCDENSASEVRAFMQPLRWLADLGATVIMIHHSGKGETSKDFRGSSDIKAAVDVAYHVSNLGDSARLSTLRLRAFKSRIAVMPEILLHYVEGAGFRRDSRAPNRETDDELRELLIESPGCTKSQFDALALKKGLTREKARIFLDSGVKSLQIEAEQGKNNSTRHTWKA